MKCSVRWSSSDRLFLWLWSQVDGVKDVLHTLSQDNLATIRMVAELLSKVGGTIVCTYTVPLSWIWERAGITMSMFTPSILSTHHLSPWWDLIKTDFPVLGLVPLQTYNVYMVWARSACWVLTVKMWTLQCRMFPVIMQGLSCTVYIPLLPCSRYKCSLLLPLQVAEYSEWNKMTSGTLATSCGQSFFPYLPPSPANTLLKFMIDHCETLFSE